VQFVQASHPLPEEMNKIFSGKAVNFSQTTLVYPGPQWGNTELLPRFPLPIRWSPESAVILPILSSTFPSMRRIYSGPKIHFFFISPTIPLFFRKQQ
jgi:hypothetical protein